jgi:hypothetical protein
LSRVLLSSYLGFFLTNNVRTEENSGQKEVRGLSNYHILDWE